MARWNLRHCALSLSIAAPLLAACGALPKASLIDVNGTLYGTTFHGGTYGYGTVFALTP